MVSKKRHSTILVFCAISILLISLVFFVWVMVDTSEKRVILNENNEVLANLVAKNEELETVLNEADQDELLEYRARQRGYVYPDEKVYYDVTPGN